MVNLLTYTICVSESRGSMSAEMSEMYLRVVKRVHVVVNC